MKLTIRILLGCILLSACAKATPAPGTQVSIQPTSTSVPTATTRHTIPASPAYTPTSIPTEPACENPAGLMVQTTYPGDVVRESVNVRIFLPPCYEISGLDYPTLYLLHGKPYDESHWDELGADELAGEAMRNGDWPPFIIVMPFAPDILFSGTDGGSWSYEEEIVEGLVPWVDQTYRTIADSEWRGFAGISRGGVWVLEISLLHPDLFDSIAALSPALAMNMARPNYDPFELAFRGTGYPQRILLMAGETDWARGETERFSQILDSIRIPHQLLITPGDHQDETWRQVLEEVLSFFADAWGGDVQSLLGTPTPMPVLN
ncbi:MAG: alpha/beta hydrolase-fold protein [Anaerolineales bacterium]